MKRNQKTRFGRVVSNKMDKTVVVVVETPRRSRIYKKVVKKLVKYKVHDKNNECQVGDIVKIVETRPLSIQKHWRVDSIIARSQVATIQPQEITE